MSKNPKGAAEAAPARTGVGQREEGHEMITVILCAGGPVGAAESVRG